MIKKPTSCSGCPLYVLNDEGYMPEADGTGEYGVLLVGEALGKNEAEAGKPFVGKAGLKLASMLAMRGLERDKFLIDNTIRCQPPSNFLVGAPYEQSAIAHCAPHLDRTIADRKPKVAVAMGATAMRRLLDLPPHTPLDDKRDPRRGYVEWSDKYNLWVIPTYHPAFLLRGNAHLTGVFLYDIEHAIEIARSGYKHNTPDILVDPSTQRLEQWVKEYEAALAARPDEVWLAYDIETPHKEEHSEDDLEFADPSYTITRIAFSYDGQNGISLTWSSHYLPYIQQLLGSSGTKLVHNGRYDCPRLIRNGMRLGGPQWDTMWAWHVINSDLRMALASIAPMLCPTRARWKHENRSSPGFYNGCDAVITAELAQRLIPQINQHGLWDVFNRHVVLLDSILDEMSASGMPIDNEKRADSSTYLMRSLERVQEEMNNVVPEDVRTLHPKQGYAKVPKDTTGLVQRNFTVKVRRCTVCGQERPSKKHWAKKDTKKSIAAGIMHDGKVHEETITRRELRWVRLEPFKPSNVQMKRYLDEQRHAGVQSRNPKTKKVSHTFNELALKVLIGRYPQDKLYPLCIEYRDIESTLKYTGWLQEDGTYDGGLYVGKDNRAHTTFSHKPSTLRLACQEPPLHQIPRGTKSDYQKLVRQMFIAEPDCYILEADFKAIEAQLVGYEAACIDPAAGASYIRLAKMGVHDFLNAHILHQNGRLPAADLPDLAWSDEDLKAALKAVKKTFPVEREAAKRTVHGGNYGMTVRRQYQLYPEFYESQRHAAKCRSVYFEVCPAVPLWQQHTIQKAYKDGHLRNPFGYMHRFWNVLHWVKQPDGSWDKEWDEGAKSALAFGPQSTAAAIIKEAMLRMAWRARNGQMRLQVHDSLMFMLPVSSFEAEAQAIIDEMERPVPELKQIWLPGNPALSIEVEAKVGKNWGELEELK